MLIQHDERQKLAFIEKEIRLAEWKIAQIRERYDVFSKESLHQAIQSGEVAGHPAWEDYIVWKNKEAHIAPGSFSGEIANRGNFGKTPAVLRHHCEQGAEK